jgi:apolipoprotein N-acyltransferase
MTSFAAAAASGLLLSLIFPPFGLHFLGWVAFLPLFWALEPCRTTARGALYGGLMGLAFFGLDVRWIYGTLVTHGHFPPIPAAAIYVALVLWLSLYGAAFGFLVVFFHNRGTRPAIMAPFLWTALELARSWLFTGFPWDLVGHSLVQSLTLVQVADITGVYGISFLVVLVNAALWELTKGFVLKDATYWRIVAMAGVVLLCVLIYGTLCLDAFPPHVADRAEFKIGVLQGNIPQELKWAPAVRQHTFDTYEALGSQAVDQGASMLVWPETSAPVLFGGNGREWKTTEEISSRLGVPMLVGAPSERKVDRQTEYFNSAFLVDGDMLRFRYDKIHLVPFGEYMPLSWLLPLGPGIAARDADYSAGRTMTVMRYGACPPFSVLICYEAIFPELAREAIHQGAHMLVNITNDGWFGDSAAPHQHMAIAGMRAIENRVWLLRAANNGISAAFDPAGRVVKQIPLNHGGFFTVSVSSGHPGSLYSRYGDIFAWGCVAMSVLVGALCPLTRLNARHGMKA